MPALLVQHTLFSKSELRSELLLLQSLYFSGLPPPTAIIKTHAPSVHLKIKMATING